VLKNKVARQIIFFEIKRKQNKTVRNSKSAERWSLYKTEGEIKVKEN